MVIGQHCFGLGILADDPVDVFDEVRGVDNLTDLHGELKESCQIVPIGTPGLSDIGVFGRPAFFKGIQAAVGYLSVRGVIDLF